jgi:hypothetical protein
MSTIGKVGSMETSQILAEAPRLVATAIERGWIRPPCSPRIIAPAPEEGTVYRTPAARSSVEALEQQQEAIQSDLAVVEKATIRVRMVRGDLFVNCPSCGKPQCLQPHGGGWRIPTHTVKRENRGYNVCVGSLEEIPVEGAK